MPEPNMKSIYDGLYSESTYPCISFAVCSVCRRLGCGRPEVGDRGKLMFTGVSEFKKLISKFSIPSLAQLGLRGLGQRFGFSIEPKQ